jgi:hypothetical protein
MVLLDLYEFSIASAGNLFGSRHSEIASFPLLSSLLSLSFPASENLPLRQIFSGLKLGEIKNMSFR